MIEIPIGKILMAVEEIHDCNGCYFDPLTNKNYEKCEGVLSCTADTRKDGKNIIFKLLGVLSQEEIDAITREEDKIGKKKDIFEGDTE